MTFKCNQEEDLVQLLYEEVISRHSILSDLQLFKHTFFTEHLRMTASGSTFAKSLNTKLQATLSLEHQ